MSNLKPMHSHRAIASCSKKKTLVEHFWAVSTTRVNISLKRFKLQARFWRKLRILIFLYRSSANWFPLLVAKLETLRVWRTLYRYRINLLFDFFILENFYSIGNFDSFHTIQEMIKMKYWQSTKLGSDKKFEKSIREWHIFSSIWHLFSIILDILIIPSIFCSRYAWDSSIDRYARWELL